MPFWSGHPLHSIFSASMPSSLPSSHQRLSLPPSSCASCASSSLFAFLSTTTITFTSSCHRIPAANASSSSPPTPHPPPCASAFASSLRHRTRSGRRSRSQSRSQSGTSPCWLQHLFFPLLFALQAISPVLADSLDGRYVLPLQRQRVPVRSGEDTVSFKSVHFGTIEVGSPNPQVFSVVFDTGSGHVIVPSTECESETCQIHRRYDRKLSPHAIDIDYDGTPVKPDQPRDQITVAFGTGEVTGQFISDRLCLGASDTTKVENSSGETLQTSGIDNKSTTAGSEAMASSPRCVDMRVVMATEMSRDPFHAFAFDGVLGLGLDSLALAPEFSFFGMLSAHQALKDSSFGVFLAENDDEVSEISFGGHSPDRVQGDIFWSPVVLPELGHWQVQIKRMWIGDQIVDYCEDGGCRAVVDTGTSLLAVPAGFAEELRHDLQRSLVDPTGEDSLMPDGHTNCRKAQGLPVHFELETVTLTLLPSDYSRASMAMEHDTDDDADEEEDEEDQEESAEQQAVQEASRTDADKARGSAEHTSKGKRTEEQSEGDTEQALSDFQDGEERQLEDEGEGEGGEDEDEEDDEVIGACRPALMPIDLPAPLGPKLFIWGEPVLRKYYTVYHWGQKSVGFGLARHSSGGGGSGMAGEKAQASDVSPGNMRSTVAGSQGQDGPLMV